MTWLNPDLIKKCLEELSSRDKQERLWYSTGPPEVSSFAEAYCQLFDDSGLGLSLEKDQVVFSDEVDRLFRILDTKLRPYSTRAAREIIDDPAFEEIRVLSRDLLSKLPD